MLGTLIVGAVVVGLVALCLWGKCEKCGCHLVWTSRPPSTGQNWEGPKIRVTHTYSRTRCLNPLCWHAKTVHEPLREYVDPDRSPVDLNRAMYGWH